MILTPPSCPSCGSVSVGSVTQRRLVGRGESRIRYDAIVWRCTSPQEGGFTFDFEDEQLEALNKKRADERWREAFGGPDPTTQSSELLKEGSIWRHRKTGGVYRIQALAKVQDSDSKWDLRPVVVYVPLGKVAPVWVRSCEEFLDGRFEEVRDGTPDKTT